MLTLGVLADTHVPDRVRRLDPAIGTLFRQAGVAAILHAGDISAPAVLDELGGIAPVYAARGNRDLYLLGGLPPAQSLAFEGVTVGLAHGCGRWQDYLVDRVHYIFFGYQLERYAPRLLRAFPAAGVIVFGHTHYPVNLRLDGRLLFNPGSAHVPPPQLAPTVGLLHIVGSQVQGEIIAVGG